MTSQRASSGAVERSTSHRLVVLQALTDTQFRELAQLCGLDRPERLKAWAEEFRFSPRPEAFARACAYASGQGLRFDTETTIAVSYRPHAWTPDDTTTDSTDRDDDVFSIDQGQLHTWLAERATEGVAARSDSVEVTYDDLHSEALHEGLADDVRELVDAGILRQPHDWNIRVLPIEDDNRWAYLAAITASDEAQDAGAPTFLMAEGVDEVWATHEAGRQLEDVVDTANNLLSLARAARIGTDPDATHHPDGMCKAHGDYDCGEDECERPDTAT